MNLIYLGWLIITRDHAKDMCALQLGLLKI